MSNVVFQPSKGLAWNIKKHPKFATGVQTASSGRQVRAAYQQYPIWEFEMPFEFLRGTESSAPGTFNELQALMGFHGGRRGGFDNFLYSDPYDNAVAMMPFGAGDGSTAAFQLTRKLGDLTDLVQNVDSSVSAPAIYKYDWQGMKNLLANSENFANWSASQNNGTSVPVITQNAALAPDGSATAAKVWFGPCDGSGLQASYIFNFTNITALTSAKPTGRNFTAAIWLRADVPCTLTLAIEDFVAAAATVAVNVTTQWKPYTLTWNNCTSTADSINITILNGGVNAASQIAYVWGAQLEENTAATSYQKTGLNAWGPTLQSSIARTNLALQSQSFVTAPWSLGSQITLTPNNVIAPDQTTTGTLASVAAGAGGNDASVGQGFTANGGVYCCSIWVRGGSGANGNQFAFGIFDSTAGAWTKSAGGIVSGQGTIVSNASNTQVTGLGSTWTKLYFLSTAIPNGHSCVVYLYLGSGSTTTCNQWIWGCQLEAGLKFPSGYIPTTTTTVTVTDYTLGSTGIVAFAAAPAANALLAWTGNYYFRVRFVDDLLDFNEMMYQLWEMPSLKMESVIL